MHGLNYIRLQSQTDRDIPQMLQVYLLPEIARFISLSDRYFEYVTSTENVYFYKVYDGDTLVGTIHLEKHDSVLAMVILVFSEFQRRGLGLKIARDIQNDVFGLGCDQIEISVDETNAASRRLFEKAGFVPTTQEDELINYVYRKKRRP